MKKEITVPVNLIRGIGLITTGVITSNLVDKSLAKVDDCHPVTKMVGRIGATFFIRTSFMALAAKAMEDESNNFTIGGKGKREAAKVVSKSKKSKNDLPEEEEEFEDPFIHITIEAVRSGKISVAEASKRLNNHFLMIY